MSIVIAPAAAQETSSSYDEWDYEGCVVPQDGGLWALAEMGGARFPDPRYRDSCSRNADRLLRNCGQSFSGACKLDGRQAATRLFHDDRVTVDDLMQGHYEKTAERCREEQVVVVANDSTAYDYTTHKALTGLGSVGTKAEGTGVWAYSALAMTTDGVPLGLLHLHLWTRDPKEFGKAKDRHEREYEDKESFKWTRAKQAVESFLSE